MHTTEQDAEGRVRRTSGQFHRGERLRNVGSPRSSPSVPDAPNRPRPEGGAIGRETGAGHESKTKAPENTDTTGSEKSEEVEEPEERAAKVFNKPTRKRGKRKKKQKNKKGKKGSRVDEALSVSVSPVNVQSVLHLVYVYVVLYWSRWHA